ncbi:MAG: type III-B CRISPR module RAMP protein Cmr1, partial [Anaerolineae bacterium]
MSNEQDLLAKAQASLENPQPREGWITLEREYELITPLFGGGPTPGEVDPVTPIRGTEIRGQLRFWWRATRGRGSSTLDKLRSEEERIWGSASKAS